MPVPRSGGEDYDADGLAVLPPARQGDVYRAVAERATAIGLVDGLFGNVPSVWHKEILHALSQGVRVVGGALRAAECHLFGMEAIGTIAADYLSGARREDADVCLVHCPAELDYRPLSEPLVDVEAALAQMEVTGAVAEKARLALLRAAREMHFADRTLATMLQRAGLPAEMAAAYEGNRVRAKAADALAVVTRLRHLRDSLGPRPDWTFTVSDPWRNYLARLSA